MASLQLSLSSLPWPDFRPTRKLIIQCSADRQALFNRISPVYDNLNDVLSLGQHRIWKRMAVSWSRAKEGDNVLDVCCGSGDLMFLMSERVGPHGKSSGIKILSNLCQDFLVFLTDEYTVAKDYTRGAPFSRDLRISTAVGFDFSKEQLLIASSRQKLRSKTCYKNIKWMEGNALDLPFPDSSFDAVTIGYGLRNVVDRHKAMAEIYRVLKPGSTVSVLDFNKSINPLSTTIQEMMIDNIVVPVASGYGLEDEYKYLKSSIKDFLTGNELEKLAIEVGFSSAKHFEIGFGFMGILVAIR